VREWAAGHFLYSGQIAAWRADRTVCERAVGRFSYLGWIVAWRMDRTIHEWAVSRFSYSGRIRVMNSNFSQFIFCSEIV
jgi:hypothetical protein